MFTTNKFLCQYLRVSLLNSLFILFISGISGLNSPDAQESLGKRLFGDFKGKTGWDEPSGPTGPGVLDVPAGYSVLGETGVPPGAPGDYDLIGEILTGNGWEVLNPNNISPRRHATAIFIPDFFGPDLDVIWIIGGRDNTTVYGNILMYMPNSDTWWDPAAPIFNLNTPRYGHAAVFLNWKIYVMGGFAGLDETMLLNTMEIFDFFVGPPWVTGPSMAEARAYHSAAIYNAKIYVFTGFAGGATFLNSVEEFDPTIPTWTTKTNIPTPRSLSSATEVNGIIYVTGGLTGTPDNANTNAIEAYDPVGNSWNAALKPMPSRRRGLVTLAYNNEIYAFGGYHMGELSVVEKFTPPTIPGDFGWWSPIAPMNFERRNSTGVIIDNKMYIIGGNRDETISGYNEVYHCDKKKYYVFRRN